MKCVNVFICNWPILRLNYFICYDFIFSSNISNNIFRFFLWIVCVWFTWDKLVFSTLAIINKRLSPFCKVTLPYYLDSGDLVHVNIPTMTRSSTRPKYCVKFHLASHYRILHYKINLLYIMNNLIEAYCKQIIVNMHPSYLWIQL